MQHIIHYSHWVVLPPVSGRLVCICVCIIHYSHWVVLPPVSGRLVCICVCLHAAHHTLSSLGCSISCEWQAGVGICVIVCVYACLCVCVYACLCVACLHANLAMVDRVLMGSECVVR